MYMNNGNLPWHLPLTMNHPPAHVSHLSPAYPSLHVHCPSLSVQPISTEPIVLHSHSEDIFIDDKNSLQNIINLSHLYSLGNPTNQMNKHHIFAHQYDLYKCIFHLCDHTYCLSCHAHYSHSLNKSKNYLSKTYYPIYTIGYNIFVYLYM